MYAGNVKFKMPANKIKSLTQNIEFTFSVYQNLWNTIRFVELKSKQSIQSKDIKNHQHWNGQHTLLMKYVDFLSPYIQLKKSELELLQYKQTYDEICVMMSKTNKKAMYENQIKEFEKKYELAYDKWYKNYNGLTQKRIENCIATFEKLNTTLSRK